MKKAKPSNQRGSNTLSQIFKLLSEIQRDELEMTESSNSYARLHQLYGHLELLKSQLVSECGPHRSRLMLQRAKQSVLPKLLRG